MYICIYIHRYVPEQHVRQWMLWPYSTPSETQLQMKTPDDVVKGGVKVKGVMGYG
jgi:hypothetical protein